MRAVQIVSPGQSLFIDIPKPEPRPGEVLIRAQQLSLCGSDTHAVYHMPESDYPLPPGMSGHEVIGVVEEVNAPGSTLKKGDVGLALVIGNEGMAEYSTLPVENMLLLPDGKPIEHLLQAQQLGTVLYAAQSMKNAVNKDVVVIGQGSAGLWWTYVMRRKGARRVIAVDLQSHRLAISSHYGATHTVHNAEVDPMQAVQEILGGKLADIVVEAGGEPSTINLAIDLVERYGHIFFFGVPRKHGEMPFHMFDFFRKCVSAQTMVGALSDPGHSCTRMAMDLIASGAADVGPMITHHFPLNQIQDAYELQYTLDEGAVKIIIDMPN